MAWDRATYVQRHGVVSRELRLGYHFDGDVFARLAVRRQLHHAVRARADRVLHLVELVDVCLDGARVGLHARVVVV